MKHINRRSIIIALLLFLGTITAGPLQAQDFSVIKTIDVDTPPFGITPSPDGRTMWVANSGGVPAQGGPPNSNTITIIDIGLLEKQAEKITVGKFPEDIVFNNSGRYAVVTNSADGTVVIIEAASRKVVQTLSIAPAGLGHPFGVIFNRNNSKIFVTTAGSYDKAVAVLDSRNMNQVRLAGTLPVPGYPGRPLLMKDNRLLVPASPSQIGTAQLFVIDSDSAKIKRELHMPTDKAFANDIAVSSDGRFAYISLFAFTGGHGGVWVIDLKNFKTVTVIDTGDQSVFGMGITPDGKFIFATNFFQNQVAVIDPKTNKVIATIPVGRRPNKVAVSLDGKDAFVTNQGSTTVSVIAIPQK